MKSLPVKIKVLKENKLASMSNIPAPFQPEEVKFVMIERAAQDQYRRLVIDISNSIIYFRNSHATSLGWSKMVDPAIIDKLVSKAIALDYQGEMSKRLIPSEDNPIIFTVTLHRKSFEGETSYNIDDGTEPSLASFYEPNLSDPAFKPLLDALKEEDLYASFFA